MSWAILVSLCGALGLALVAWLARRAEIARMLASAGEVATARERGSHRARLQYPQVDLSRCIGCGTCVAACPEEGVLELVHGQALVAHGARCVGHGRCAVECPVGAVAVTLGDISERKDIPALSESLEAVGSPGLFLAGEVTGYALIRTAIGHGTSVANEVARRSAARKNGSDELDLVVVGAGPAGLACSLEAKRRGLDFVTIDQEGLGGTVAKYPRRKLVMTQPVDLPLHGRLSRTTYTKEELIELWSEIACEHELPIRAGVAYLGLERTESGSFRLHTSDGPIHARHVCLALGRRGSPRKLGVPGEELSKVAYGLIDAQSYRDRRVAVIGGGDSAVEAAVGLAEQPGTEVYLSYRKGAFTRIKARNEAKLLEAQQSGRLAVVLDSEVERIRPDAVELRAGINGEARRVTIPNDEVFVLAGGIPPFELLERSGVSFDPADHRSSEPLVDQRAGLGRAIAVAFVLALVALGWTLAFRDYYELPLRARSGHPRHGLLRPAAGIGLGLGIAGAVAILANLAYLLRRSPKIRFEAGSLKGWMSVHVATGVLALLFALVHAAMAPRHTVGGHGLAALVVLVATGAIGRYFYSFVPHAANGRELALEEVRSRLADLGGRWDRLNRSFGERVQREVDGLIAAGHWQGSFFRRLLALLTNQRGLRAALVRLQATGRAEGVPAAELRESLALARRAHRTALAAAHYEDLRGLLASWRYLHRWVALLMVLLVAAHVVTALRFGGILGGTP